jgi:hypothetical protein
MSNQNSSKGNPAHKRMSNPAKKAVRQNSWNRCQKRKAARREAQAQREAANRRLRAEGLPTPWEAARAARKARRAAEREAA